MARSLLSLFAPVPAVPPDAELLRRWADGRDAAAFELLVRRHAAAVAAVCTQVLRHSADADDAFQATFLALAKNAGSVRTDRSLGGWLYRVAVNAARKLRAKRRETVPLPDVPASAAPFDDTAETLHAELTKLPKAYQAVLAAVDLGGHSHTDAAALLGWPVGTVSGRLVRAREQLKRRLVRRGVGAVLVAGAASETGVRAAVDVACWAAVASPGVLSLSAEVGAMATSKLKLGVACGLVVAALSVGVGVVAAQVPGVEKKAEEKKADPSKLVPERTPKQMGEVEPPKLSANEKDAAEVKLAKEIVAAELKRVQLLEKRILVGSLSGCAVYQQLTEALADLTTAADEAFPQAKDRLGWYEYRLAVAESAEWFTKPRVENGIEEPQLLPQLTAARLKAELTLVKLKKQIK